MGIFSAIGKIAGTAIGAVFGGPAGATIGGKIGGAAGGALDSSGKKKSTPTQEQQPYLSAPKVTLEDIRSGSPSAYAILGKREEKTKTAKAADIPAFGPTKPMSDPWVPMNEWWVDLGGEPGRLKPIDDTRF